MRTMATMREEIHSPILMRWKARGGYEEGFLDMPLPRAALPNMVVASEKRMNGSSGCGEKKYEVNEVD